MNYSELTNEQRQRCVDISQVYQALLDAERKQVHSYVGSMRWLKRGKTEYLHVKKGRTEKSLGPRSPQTEEQFQKFTEGQHAIKERIKDLESRLEDMAPVNRAMNLGRVPLIVSKILRQLYKQELLGKNLLVVGTSALWAYEIQAGVLLQSNLLATLDTDLLWDARTNVKLISQDKNTRGIISVLKKIDRSFEKRGPRDYKATNNRGFAVDLIRPQDKLFFLEEPKKETIANDDEDLFGTPIEGLEWLINAPKFSSIAIGEDGLPVPIVTVDPRIFALHKLWIASRLDREALKTQRDRAQARAVGEIAKKFLNLRFDDEKLRLPKELKKFVTELDL